MKAILYVGHGTRSKMGANEVKSFLRKVMDRVDVPIQEISFLELTEPYIEEGFQKCVERGATEIVVVPLFLLAAGHIKKDIPEELSQLRNKYPHVKVLVRNPFGIQERILDCLAEVARDTVGFLTSRDSILIVGRGSSDPSIHAAFARIVKGIQQRLHIENVSVCYLAATVPTFEEGLEAISKTQPDRIIVIPYLLFPGLLLSEVNQNVRKRQRRGQNICHTGSLSEHQIIEDIVIQRALEENQCSNSL